MDMSYREEMIRGLKAPEPEIRENAAKEMGASGDETLLPYLEEVLDDTSPKVRWRALHAVARLGGPTPEGEARVVSLLADASNLVRGEAVLTLASLRRKEHVVLLSPLLQDPDLQVKCRAIEAFGEIREVDSPTLDRVLQVLEDPDPRLRMHAALTLGACRHSPAIPKLTESLKDEKHVVRGHAAWALGQLGDAGTLGPLIDSLSDMGDTVRLQAYQSIARFGETALPVLRDALAGAAPDEKVLLDQLIEDINTGEDEEPSEGRASA